MSDTCYLYKYEILHLNIRGARANKSNLIKYLSDCNSPEIITLNETKLGSSIQFDLPGYNCAARKEINQYGGTHGSMILVRSDLSDISEIEEITEKFPQLEILGIVIKHSTVRPELKVFTHYIPPKTSPNPKVLEFISSQNGNCILTGDLNCKSLVWGSSKTDTYGEDLHDQIQRNGLYILNDGSKTRCDPVSGKEEALDIVISNIGIVSMFRNFWVGDDVGSDHYPIHTLLQFRSKPIESRGQEQRVEWTDWKAFQQKMLSWPSLDTCNTPNDIDQAVQTITQQTTDAFNTACPLRDKKKPPKCRFTPEIEAKVKEKRHLRRQKNMAAARGNQLEVRRVMTRINFLGNEIKKLQKQETKKDLERHCESLNRENDPKKFFQIFKKISNPIINTEPKPTNTRKIIDEWGNAANSSQEKATLFANRLQRVHQEPDFRGFNDGWKASVERYLSANQHTYELNPASQYLQAEEGDDSTLLKEVTVDELRENLARCKNKSAHGLDGIRYSVIKKIPDTYLNEIAKVFSSCLKLGYFPTAWKTAKTILIPKPGKDLREAKNFRPISLLSCLGKLLERLLAHRISRYMEEENLFTSSQSGFRSHHMTAEQLLRLSEQCHNAFKNKQVVASLFLDAEAAFDKCWHSGIKYKLKKNLGLPNRLIRLISSFLTDRSLTVFYEGHWSHKVYLKAGTPQGSPLSPLIYLIFVNDFPGEILNHCNLSQFADDTSLSTTAYTEQFATQKLQKGLNLLEGWCRRWRVKLNAGKSKFVIFSRIKEENQENFKIALFDDIISPSSEARFLGINFDRRLSFNNHINEITTRAYQRMNVLRALSRSKVSPPVIMRLYKTYILSLVEYGSSTFVATSKGNREKLQKIQNEAIRLCLNLPRYIRIELLHEYAGIERIWTRLLQTNRSLLGTMSARNEHIHRMAQDQPLSQGMLPVSPLDLMMST